MELARFPLRGGFSVQSIFTFALTALIAALLWVVFFSTPTFAAEGRWTDGDAILFDNHAYNKDTTINSQTDAIPEGATVYKAPAQTENGNSTVMVIYFSPGLDPPAEQTANHLTFDYSGSTVSNPHDAKTIDMSPRGEDTTALAETHSSCNVDGIGWMICPISVFLAESMDWIYTVIEQFVVTPPLMMETENNGVYTAWNVARSIANVAFVIVFLVIIYSQLTSLGVSNYGLKKLTPRLIVAAVLVNLSFYISALAIDISNIIGGSIVDIFTGIREATFQLTSDNFGDVNDEPWSYITTIALAGGGLIGGIYYLVVNPFVLVVMLVGLAFVALVVLLILAARQAIITLLVIVSPLAFVANLLPNTEKWFERWRDLFMTMLIFFPAFAFVFGGSQLAGQLIIQNANGNIITVILGLGVQVAPLVITPWLLKLSGGLLGRIAQIANNPSKGLMDRTKGWAGEKNDIHRNRLQSAGKAAAPFRVFENNRRARKSQLERYQNMADVKWEQSKRAQKLAEGKADSEEAKNKVHSEHAAHLDSLKAGTGHRLNKRVDLHKRAMEAEGAKVDSELSGAELAASISAYRAGAYDTGGNTQLDAIQSKMARNVIATSAWSQASNNNKGVEQSAIAAAMRNESALQDIAQGSGTAEQQMIGRDRAVAGAIATITKLNKDARDNVITLMETEAVEAGDTVKDFAVKNIFAKAKSTDPAQRALVSRSRLEAALEIAIADGQVGVFDEARSSEFIDQSIIDAVVARNVGTFKGKGGFHIQANPKLSLQRYIAEAGTGKAVNDAGDIVATEAEARALFTRDLKRARLDTLSNANASNLGDLKAGPFEKLAGDMLGGDAQTGHLLDTIAVGPDGKPVNAKDREMVERTFKMLRDGLLDPSTRATMSDRIKQVREIEEIYRSRFYSDYDKLVLPGDNPHGTPTP